MKAPKRRVPALAAAVAMIAVAGCSETLDPIPDNTPFDQQVVEATLDEALQTTLGPMVNFIGAMRYLLGDGGTRTADIAAETCPDTRRWCSSGTVSCWVMEEFGPQFDFDACQLLAGDLPLTIDGHFGLHYADVVTVGMQDFVINNTHSIGGRAAIDIGCSYVLNINSLGVGVSGTITVCDTDEYPTGEALVIAFHPFSVTINFDGSSIASATVKERLVFPVATCTIDLDSDPPSSDCHEI